VERVPKKRPLGECGGHNRCSCAPPKVPGPSGTTPSPDWDLNPNTGMLKFSLVYV
jgi:hypothetical protein